MRQTTNYRSRTFTGKIRGPTGCERKHERTKTQKGTIFVFKELEQQNI
jgi:hypothetical protein